MGVEEHLLIHLEYHYEQLTCVGQSNCCIQVYLLIETDITILTLQFCGVYLPLSKSYNQYDRRNNIHPEYLAMTTE